METILSDPKNWMNFGAWMILGMIVIKVVPWLGKLLTRVAAVHEEFLKHLLQTLDTLSNRLNDHEVTEEKHYADVKALVESKTAEIRRDLITFKSSAVAKVEGSGPEVS